MVRNYVRMLFVLLILCSTQLFAQDASRQSWRSLMESSKVTFTEIYKTCPHFPQIDAFKDDTSFIASVQKWQKEYATEVSNFWKIDGIQKTNPSAYYLGLSNGVKPDVFESSIWEWVHNSNITDARLAELAPHFPKPQLTGNTAEDTKTYEYMLDYWVKLYPIEYEKLINSKELVALNPFYEGYIKPVIIPAFLAAPLHETKPFREAYSKSLKGELSYQLSIRAWYFVFEPETFNSLYGSQYEFPEWFNVEKFRADVKRKFELTKNTPAEMLEKYQGK